ncbi:phosphate ABC transporter substrate-binding/OmpA family protein [Parasulfitobacter algicola]|uniref:Substrate-binding domain-containing protein n=1 Tax=Parasulfitobacter algicola TaxID=2614809 RepID=A0ABX2ITB8_9RHOB|nr:phosphate ABC transporter substrate-binding/OmpA family protein [Sulfitobacter algicola]NSX53604.1 substrate-binding domain-containing protein [Sulfitobacter algicola]
MKLRSILKNVFVSSVFVSVAGLAQAEQVTLVSNDQSLSITGELVSFNGSVFQVRTTIGQVQIAASMVTCSGPGCPAVSQNMDFSVVATSELAPKLLSELMQGFAQSANLNPNISLNGAGGVERVRFTNQSGDSSGQVDVQSVPALQGLQNVLDGQSDITLSSAAVTPQIARRLRGNAEEILSDADRQKVIALEAIVPIVHPDNIVRSVTLEQLARIASGEITNWSQLGGANQTIRMVLPADDTPEFQLFKSRVTDPNRVRVNNSVDRLSRNERPTDVVFRDTSAISIASFGEEGDTQVVPIRLSCGPVAYPTTFNIKAEEYPLTNRVFLYTSENPSRSASAFTNFALSEASNNAISASGFVDQQVTALPIDFQGTRIATALTQAVNNDQVLKVKDFADDLAEAQRLSTTFRFRTGSSQLDNKAVNDIGRVGEYLVAEAAGREIMVVGFTDSVGREDLNLLLANRRAEQVRDAILASSGSALSASQVEVKSFGPLAPVGCNETQQGRADNRRVEIWVR